MSEGQVFLFIIAGVFILSFAALALVNAAEWYHHKARGYSDADYADNRFWTWSGSILFLLGSTLWGSVFYFIKFM